MGLNRDHILMKVYTLPFCFLILTLISCSGKKNENYVPKPKGYNRIDLPKNEYTVLDQKHPYTFQVSKFAEVLPDTFRGAGKDWLFIHYPAFKANIQLTYKSLDGSQKVLQDYINDSYKLAGKHQIRASSIQEQKVLTKDGKAAMIFKIEGDVPSPFQFYTTDSTRHFMRGAIYFSTAIKNDSLAPVIQFVERDMIQLLNTLEWR